MTDPETFLAVLRARRSVRSFLDTPVEMGVLKKLVEAAAWAPSAGARQDWEFTVVTAPEVKMRMVEAVRARWNTLLEENEGSSADVLREYAGNFDWFAAAPAIVAVSAARTESFLQHLLQDNAVLVAGRIASAAMAAQNLMLAAHACGLGSCCLTGPLAAHEALMEILQLGKRRQLVCLIALGYPAAQPSPPARKPLEQIMRIIA